MDVIHAYHRERIWSKDSSFEFIHEITPCGTKRNIDKHREEIMLNMELFCPFFCHNISVQIDDIKTCCQMTREKRLLT